MQGVPKNWVITKLDNLVSKFIGGGTPSKTNSAYYQGNIPWMTVKDMISRRPEQVAEYITLEAVNDSATNIIPTDTIIIATRMSLGKVVRVPFEVAINQDLKALILPNGIEKDFFEFWYISETFNIQSLGTGTTVKGIRLETLQQLKIPLPPLNEQKRIVAKIEALQTRTQRVKEALEAIPQLLDQFRQSVLAAAFRGDLTADWRENNPDVEPASVLLERIRVERRRKWEEAELEKMKAKGKVPKNDKWKQKYKEPQGVDDSNLPELPEGWEWTTLDQILFSLRNGLSKAPADQPPGIPILRISAVRAMEVNTGDVRFYRTNNADEINYYLLKAGDLLFTRYNGSPSFVGVCGLIPEINNNLLYPDKLIRGRLVNKSLSLPAYFELAFNSGVSRSHIESHIKTSAGQQGIAGSDIKSAPVPIPPLMEQHIIINAIQQQFLAIQNIAYFTNHCSQDIQILNQSILSKAFLGELVPQDPNDEPASVLLERIRAEQEKLQQQTKAVKKSKTKTTKTRSKKKSQQPQTPIQLELPGMEQGDYFEF